MKTTILDNELQQELENLFINNPVLSEIVNHLGRFNPIKVMGAEGSEIRHSRILGWLLDPKENHGLEDRFLKAFLAQAMQGANTPPNSLFIIVRGLTEANVYLEWNQIDIFIEIPHEQHPWCFVIENKVHSTQGKDQLKKYRKFVEKRFDRHSVGCIFLTLNDEEPKDDKYQQVYYSDIVRILSDILEESRDKLSGKIYNFIKYYCEIVRELSGMSDEHDEIKKLARKLYREHRRALDFIYEHAGGTEFEYGAQLFLNSDGQPVDQGYAFQAAGYEFVVAAVGGTWFNLVARAWEQKFNSVLPDGQSAWPGCESWKGLGIPVKAWVEMVEKTKSGVDTYGIKLVAEVGPLSDGEDRVQLVKSLLNSTKSEKKVKFSAKSQTPGVKYSRFINLSISVDNPFDAKEIAAKITSLFSEFAKILPSINVGIDDFCQNFSKQDTDDGHSE